MVVDYAIDDENVDPIARVGFHAYGVTLAKKYPPYVFSIRGVSCLVHKVQCVEMHWWRIAGHGDKLIKMKRLMRSCVADATAKAPRFQNAPTEKIANTASHGLRLT